jgi:protein-tyrosine phosphatase
MEEIAEMIDLHSHILFGMDDGAKTLGESIRMCWIGYRDGIRTIVATPHTLNGVYQNDRSTILSRVQELNEAIKKFGVQSSEFGVKDFNAPAPQRLNVNSKNSINSINPMTEFRILAGADVHFSSDVFQRYESGEIVTANDQGRFLMVEFAFQGIPYQAEEVLFQLLARGIVPIISHPERNFEIGQSPKRYYQMIKMGCLGQVTAMSLTGEFGPQVRSVAGKLLAHRLIHFIASDAHSVNGRPPILSAGVRAAEKIVGKKEAMRMVTEYPEAVIEGRSPDVPEPLSP